MIKINPVLIVCLISALLCAGCWQTMPNVSRPIQARPVPVAKTESVPSYGQIMEYIQKNITSIVSSSISGPPANGTRFTQGFGFVSPEVFYVDFEDGHYAYTALLECEYDWDTSCKVLAILDRADNSKVSQGENTVMTTGFVYTRTRGEPGRWDWGEEVLK